MEMPPPLTAEVASELLRNMAIVPLISLAGFLIQGAVFKTFADTFGKGYRTIWFIWFGSCSAALLAASYIVRLYALRS